MDGEVTYTGTNTTLYGDDNFAGPINIGFTHTFYGTAYTQAYVNINGTLNFGSGFAAYSNGPLASSGQNTSIYPFWDDLITQNYSAKTIYYATIGSAPNRQFIVQWTGMYFYNNPSVQMGTFQVILFEGSNVVQIQYRDLLGGSQSMGNSATVGIKKDNSTYKQYSYNTASLTQGQAIRYTPNGASDYTVNTSAAYDLVYLAPVGAPTSPTLVNPTDGTTGITVNPTFEWLPVTSATSYTVLVSTTPTFSSTVVNQSGITGTSYTLGSALSYNTAYYWRVQAVNSNGSSLSSTRTFTTSGVPNTPPNIPTSVSSAKLIGGVVSANLTGSSLSMTLSDPDAGQPVRYRLQIASDTAFNNLKLDYRSAFGAAGSATYNYGENGGTYLVGSSTTTFADGNYYLRLRAEDDAAASSSWYTATGTAFVITQDTTPPTITSVTSTKANGSYTVGEVIPVTVNFSEPVTSTGSVTVTLATGATNRSCTFTVSGASSGSCNYTVQAGDASADLTTNSISGTIKDAAQNTMVNFTPGTSLAASKDIVIDTTAPTIANVNSAKANGSYGVGEVIPVTVNFSEPVTSTGSVTVTLATGATNRTCAFTVSNASSGSCNYTVQAGDASADLDTVSIAGTIKDVAGNTLTNYVPATSLATNKNLAIDTTPPTITSVTSTKANGSYTVGEVIPVTVNFSEPVTSTGGVTVTLETGATDRACTLTVSGTSSGSCNYTVQAGDTSADLTTNAVSGTIKDAAQNALTNFAPATNLAASKDLVIDTTAPTITSVTSIKANGTYKAGEIIPVTVNFSEPVTSTGSVTLTLETGVTDRSCAFTVANASSGTCNYSVQTGDNTLDLTTNSIAGTVKDAAQNALTNFTPATNLAASKDLVIDAVAPTVTGVTSSLADGAYKAGQVVSIQVSFSENVTVASGAPQIILLTGSPATTAANYVSGSGSSTLNFSYTVAPGNASADLDYASAGALTLNGATLRDAVGNDANLALAVPGAAGSFGASKNLVIDTTAPSPIVSSPATDPTNGSPIPGQVTFSESVSGLGLPGISATGGTPGGLSGSGSSYAFGVTPSIQGPVSFSVPAGGAQDAAGNLSTFSNTLSRTFDDIPPTVTLSTTATSPTGTTPLTFTATFSEPVFGFTLSDIVTTNAVTGDFHAVDSTTYVFAVSPISDPVSDVVLTVSVPADSAHDAAGNGNTDSDSGVPYALTFDDHSPTVGLASTATEATNVSPIPVVATFSEDVLGFDLSGIDVTNGSADDLVASSSSTYAFNVTPSGQGPVTVQIPAGAATDLVPNPSLVSNLLTREYDTVPPTVALDSATASLFNTPTFAVTATFSEVVTGFTTSDISVTNGTASDLVGSGTDAYTFNVTPSGQGPVTVSMPALGAQDAAGNGNDVSATLSRTYDSVAPTLTETTPVATPTHDTTPTYVFHSSEAGTIAYEGDCASSNVSASLGDHSVTFDTLAEGRHNNCTLTVTDAAGNVSAPLVVNAFDLDVTAPAITGVALSSSALKADETALVTVTFDEPVIALHGSDFVEVDHGTLSTPVSTDGGLTWIATFTPTADVEEPTNVITVSAAGVVDLADNHGTGTFSSGNYALDTLRPVVAIGSPSGAVANSGPITFTVSYTGADSVTLSDSDVILNSTGTAAGVAHVTGSGTAERTVTISSISGDGTLGLSLRAGTASDDAGNLALATGPSATFTVDNTAPAITGVALSSSALKADETALVTVTFSEPVASFDSSDFTEVDNGAISAVATADGGTTWTATFTPTAGVESPTNVIAVSATGVTDLAGNPGIGAESSGNYALDTLRPTITEITSAVADGPYDVGAVIDIDVTFSEPVTSTGSVTVTLETGTVDRSCTFTVTNASSGTCDYTVHSGDVSSDLNVSSVSGSISDAAGNAMTNFTPVVNLADNKNIVVQSTVPTVVSVTSTKPDGSYTVGESIPVTVNFSKLVTSTGSVTVTLETGTVDRSCTFTVASASSGTCSYVVQAGDTSADLDVLSIAGTVKDAGNVAITDFTPATSLAATSDLVIDTTAPTIVSVSSSHADGSFTVGESIPVAVTFSEPVTSTGAVTVTLETGATDRTCTFTVTNSPNTYCNYVVQAGDTSARLDVLSIAGTLHDAAGNAMSNFVPTTNLAANKNIVIDTTAPTIVSVTSSQANGVYVTGAVIPVTVNFSEPVTSTGAVTVTLETGATDRTCTFTVTNSASGTCDYVVQTGDYTLDLDDNSIVGTSSDAAGNALTDFTPGTSLATNKNLIIDATDPTITNVSSSQADGSYTIGAVIPISVTFSEPVTSTGSVTVTLATGATDRACTFTVSNASSGTCDYTVQAGDTSADLDLFSIAGTIKDIGQTTLTNFTPATGLAANKNLVIDTTPPTIADVSSTKDNGVYATNAIIPIDVTFSEPVTSTGAVTVTLETGVTDQTCTFTVTNSASGTCDYVVQSIDYSADLNVLSIAGTLVDAAGNAMVNFVPATNLAVNKNLIIAPPRPAQPQVTLGQPIGGETLTAGASYLVLWSSAGHFDSVRISLSTDGGVTFPTVIYSGPTASGSYSWTVPDLRTTSAKLKIELLGTSLSDTSGGTFSIVGPTPTPKSSVQGGFAVSGRSSAIINQPNSGSGTTPAPTPTPTPAPTLAPAPAPIPGLPNPEDVGLVPPSEPLNTDLKKGDAGHAVDVLKAFLKANGYQISDGDVFDDSTVLALSKFQADHTDAGALGNNSLRLLNDLLRRQPGGSCQVLPLGLIPPRQAITRQLKLGDVGTDVQVLQQFLNDNGFLLAGAGSGSESNETTYFGTLTQAALAKFQRAFGAISEKGRLGPNNRFFINGLLANPPILQCPALIPPTAALNRDLKLGSKGQDVQVLQRFLNVNGFVLAAQVEGSIGKETTYFGTFTRASLKRFQSAFGLTSEKYVLGPKTRAFINALIGS